MIKILLIEDDRWLADSYMDVLDDYETDMTVSAQEALDMLDSNDYELIIADVMIERGLVFDLLHELQTYDDTAHIPVVLCTSLAQRITLADVASYGVVAVLNKATLTPKLLREAVEQAVE